jgi:hypothetical protein
VERTKMGLTYVHVISKHWHYYFIIFLIIIILKTTLTANKMRV